MEHEDFYKIVAFDLFCRTCKHEKLKENEKPCCECLEHPVNLYTHKPTEWEAK